MPLEVRTRIDVRWRDLDMLGHLNQSVYHELLEEGRAALFQQLDALEAFVLARVELDYRLEVRRDHGPVEIVVRITRVGRSSVTVEHDVVRDDGEVAATGSSVLVAWDPEARRSRPLGDAERARLTDALGATPA
ncbi:MAG TPA: thioesterase family protein [Solirubrobacteraceae bacterium]|nr:thioesterase family protein [Solirubrobacteraceae bacterium]